MYWYAFGIIAYFVSMIGVYEPYWKRDYHCSPGLWIHLIILVSCLVLGVVGFVASLILLIANIDLWTKK